MCVEVFDIDSIHRRTICQISKGGYMPKVMSLGHVGLYVRDIERSKAFYRDMLGLEVSDQSPKTGSTFMTAKGRLAEHHELLLVPGREDGKVMQQLSFRCASLADVKAFTVCSWSARCQSSAP
jgi:catechol-2,3-dioxygenase